jgi:hypothetical protein
MKQKFLLLAMALLGCMNVAQAKDGVTSIQDATIKQGGFGCITIKCNMQDRYYNAFQIEFKLPEGLHFNQGVADYSLTGIGDPNFVMNDKKTGKEEGVFIFMNMQAAEFEKGEYDLVKIYFKADKEMKVGTYPITITALSLSGSNGKDYSPFSPVEEQLIDAPESFSVEITPGGPRVLSDTATELPEDNYTYVTQEVTEYEEYDEEQGKNVTKYKFGPKEEITVAEDFTIGRSIKADTWSTLCLPFPVTLTELKEALSDPEIVYWDGWDCSAENDKLDLFFYQQEVEEIDANYPLLIKTSKDFNDGFTFKEKIIECDEENASVKIEVGRGSTKRISYFNGVLKAGLVPDGSLFFSGNKFYYSTGKSPIKAFRAYLTIDPKDNLQEKAIISDGSVNVGIMINETPTYVEGISTKRVSNDDVYSISGIKMGTENDLKSMQPGMYIVNGKKVIVK